MPNYFSIDMSPSTTCNTMHWISSVRQYGDVLGWRRCSPLQLIVCKLVITLFLKRHDCIMFLPVAVVAIGLLPLCPTHLAQTHLAQMGIGPSGIGLNGSAWPKRVLAQVALA